VYIIIVFGGLKYDIVITRRANDCCRTGRRAATIGGLPAFSIFLRARIHTHTRTPLLSHLLPGNDE